MTLTDFLLARIAEDAAAVEGFWDDGGDPDFIWGPGRIRVECEAKRRIVARAGVECVCTDHGAEREEGCAQCLACHAVTTADGYVLADLTLPYADHPDYNESWKP